MNKQNGKNYILIFLLLTAIPLRSAENPGENKRNSEESQEQKQEKYNAGILSGAASLFPGIILHGSGHFVAGDRETAKDLFIIESGSLFAFLGFSAYFGYTGASSKVSGPVVPLIATSGTVFLLSWFADIYGSTVGMNRSNIGINISRRRYIKLITGYLYVDDVQFDYRGFLHYGFEIRYNAFFLKPVIWQSRDDNNARYLVEAGYELAGPSGVVFKDHRGILRAGPLFRGGYHDYNDYGFNKKWIDICVTSEFSPGAIWKSLRGSRIFFEWGYNREWVTFTVIDKSPVFETDQVLFKSGFGIDLGNLYSPAGSISFYYNHRRDDFTGGMTGGFTGYVGLKGEVAIMKRFSLSLDYSYGAARVLDLSCSFIF